MFGWSRQKFINQQFLDAEIMAFKREEQQDNKRSAMVINLNKRLNIRFDNDEDPTSGKYCSRAFIGNKEYIKKHSTICGGNSVEHFVLGAKDNEENSVFRFRIAKEVIILVVKKGRMYWPVTRARAAMGVGIELNSKILETTCRAARTYLFVIENDLYKVPVCMIDTIRENFTIGEGYNQKYFIELARLQKYKR